MVVDVSEDVRVASLGCPFVHLPGERTLVLREPEFLAVGLVVEARLLVDEFVRREVRQRLGLRVDEEVLGLLANHVQRDVEVPGMANDLLEPVQTVRGFEQPVDLVDADHHSFLRRFGTLVDHVERGLQAECLLPVRATLLHVDQRRLTREIDVRALAHVGEVPTPERVHRHVKVCRSGLPLPGIANLRGTVVLREVIRAIGRAGEEVLGIVGDVAQRLTKVERCRARLGVSRRILVDPHPVSSLADPLLENRPLVAREAIATAGLREERLEPAQRRRGPVTERVETLLFDDMNRRRLDLHRVDGVLAAEREALCARLMSQLIEPTDRIDHYKDRVGVLGEAAQEHHHRPEGLARSEVTDRERVVATLSVPAVVGEWFVRDGMVAQQHTFRFVERARGEGEHRTDSVPEHLPTRAVEHVLRDRGRTRERVVALVVDRPRHYVVLREFVDDRAGLVGDGLS